MPNWCRNNLFLLSNDEEKLIELIRSLDKEQFFKYVTNEDCREATSISYDRQGEYLHVNFDTAWCPPTHIIEKLSEDDNFTVIEFTYYEGGMGFIGKMWDDCGTLVEESYNLDEDDGIPIELCVDVGMINEEWSTESLFQDGWILFYKDGDPFIKMAFTEDGAKSNEYQ